MFTKTLLKISIPMNEESGAIHYSGVNYTDHALNKLKVISFLLYAVRMIWNLDSDYKPLRLQLRHFIDNPPVDGTDRASPITFASNYTEKRSMQLLEDVDNPIIIFTGKVVKKLSGSFFIYTKLGKTSQYNISGRYTPVSTFIFLQDLIDTLPEEYHEDIFLGLKAILTYFDGVQEIKWSVRVMNDAVEIVNAMI